MEYDTDRAGGLEPLELLPKGKQRIMAGFITTKTAELEKADWLKAKFDEASKYVDLDQLGIAPQCGFASTEEATPSLTTTNGANWIWWFKPLKPSGAVFNLCPRPYRTLLSFGHSLR